MSIPIWTAVNKLAQHAEELAARVKRLEQRNKDELANWRTAAVRQGEIERRLERLEQAQQQPEPSTPAGQGELVRSVALAITDDEHDAALWDDESRAAILAVVLWLESQAWRGAADALRREVER